jgi:hypothetical protein
MPAGTGGRLFSQHGHKLLDWDAGFISESAYAFGELFSPRRSQPCIALLTLQASTNSHFAHLRIASLHLLKLLKLAL